MLCSNPNAHVTDGNSLREPCHLNEPSSGDDIGNKQLPTVSTATDTSTSAQIGEVRWETDEKMNWLVEKDTERARIFKAEHKRQLNQVCVELETQLSEL